MAGWPYLVKCEIAFTAFNVAPTWTDVTSRLIRFKSEVGQQYDYDGPQPGSLTVVLDNTDGALDPTNTSSIYYPNVKLKRQVRISAQLTSGSSLVYLAHGYVDSWTRSWPGGVRVSRTTVECTDLVEFYARWVLSGLSQTAGTAAVHMAAISSASTPAPAGGLDIVTSTYNGNQWEYIKNLAVADGGLFYIDGQGSPVYLTSTYLATSTRSTTSQDTFAFGLATGTEVTDDLAPALDDRLLANAITVVDAAGTNHTATNSTSVAEYGSLPFSITTTGPGGTGLTASAADTRAASLRTRRAFPDVRVESLTIDALTGNQQMTDALALKMGDRITLVTQPLGGGSSASRPYLITGISHDVDFIDSQWLTTYQVEPAAVYAQPAAPSAAGSQVQTFNGTTSTAATAPPGAQVGDLLVLYGLNANGQGSFDSLPAGWTVVRSETATNAGSKRAYCVILTKTASAADIAGTSSYPYTVGSGYDIVTTVAYRKADGTTPVLAVHDATLITTSGILDITAPSVTAPSVGLLTCVFGWGNSNSSGATTATTPAGMTVRRDTTYTNYTHQIIAELAVSAGATGTRIVTPATGNATSPSVAQTIVIT